MIKLKESLIAECVSSADGVVAPGREYDGERLWLCSYGVLQSVPTLPLNLIVSTASCQ